MYKIVYYEHIINHKWLEVHTVRVVYHDNDVCAMDGYLFADNVFDIARIIRGYGLRKIEVIENV